MTNQKEQHINRQQKWKVKKTTHIIEGTENTWCLIDRATLACTTVRCRGRGAGTLRFRLSSSTAIAFRCWQRHLTWVNRTVFDVFLLTKRERNMKWGASCWLKWPKVTNNCPKNTHTRKERASACRTARRSEHTVPHSCSEHKSGCSPWAPNKVTQTDYRKVVVHVNKQTNVPPSRCFREALSKAFGVSYSKSKLLFLVWRNPKQDTPQFFSWTNRTGGECALHHSLCVSSDSFLAPF